MEYHRIAVANNLSGKISEMGFFFHQIIETAGKIEQKHIQQRYPINPEIEQLNYFFSALLNSIQSTKDSCQTYLGITIAWEELSPTHGKFIYYCRNATTHDGSQIINAGLGTKNYIAGPLRRIDSKKAVKKFDPPHEDVETLVFTMTKEVLAKIKHLLMDRANLPKLADSNSTTDLDAALSSHLVPELIKNLIRDNKKEIVNNIQKAPPIDYAANAINAIHETEATINQRWKLRQRSKWMYGRKLA